MNQNGLDSMVSIIGASASINGSIRYKPLIPPDLLKFEIPKVSVFKLDLTLKSSSTVERGRAEAAAIIHGRDDLLLVIVGPRSIRDVGSVISYGNLLAQTATQLKKDICIIMGCDVEKPRTLRECKGFIKDPHLQGTDETNKGLRLARHMLVQLTDMGLQWPRRCLEVRRVISSSI